MKFTKHLVTAQLFLLLLSLTSCAKEITKAQDIGNDKAALLKEPQAQQAVEIKQPAPVTIQDFPENEPSIAELQRAAIRYAEVHPDKITNWRRQAAIKALMPEVSVGYNTDTGSTIDNTTSKDGKITYFTGPDDESKGWDFSAKWDLGDLIYNDAQTSIDSRSKLMVQLRNDILEQLNPAYFERKKLILDLNRIPDKTSQAYIEREIRVEELTATIDGLTGGYLSRRLAEE